MPSSVEKTSLMALLFSYQESLEPRLILVRTFIARRRHFRGKWSIEDLKKNGYSSSFIERIARRQGLARQHQMPVDERRPRRVARISVPYVKGTSEALARVLGKEGILVAHKPTSTLGRFMPRPKDRLPKERAQGVVYTIPCAECPATYIGETKNFPERIRQHKNDVRKFDSERSALAEHCDTLDHRIDFANAHVVDTEPNFRRRLFLESWQIQHTPGNLNRSLGALPSVYAHGLRDLTEKLKR